MIIKAVSWNVNSINSRLQDLLDWLKDNDPDIVFLQEIKADFDKFPLFELNTAGYNVISSLEKRKNGVSILSKHDIKMTAEFLADKEGQIKDTDARFIEGNVNINGKDVSVACVYVPAGGFGNVNRLSEGDQIKFKHKIDFLRRLYRKLNDDKRPQIIGGDFNIAPSLEDVHSKTLDGNVCSSEKERFIFKELLKLGYMNSLDYVEDLDNKFTWWSYQFGVLQKNQGLRLDHVMVDEGLDCKVVDGLIDMSLRKTAKPSDHAPVIVHLEL
ncbi:MAG: exodeoxyribonuclease III [Proteobacteria bacterium]|nr:exodeoxyribonuclease III [Pseudomonadota bacterium]